MKRTGRIISALALATLLSSSAACVVTAHGRVRTGAVVVYEEPPAPRDEIEYSQTRSGYVWVRGRYDWQGGQWVWMPGHYERERAGYMWNDGRWERRDNSWHWVEGTWVVSGSGGGTIVTDGRPQEVDHRGGGYGNAGGNPPPVVGHAGNPDGSGVGVVSGGGQVVVQVHGPTSAPPPVRVENPGPARGGYLWVRGYYQWNQGGNQYEWVPGHWEREKAGMQWFDGRWELQGNVYVWVEGGWKAGGPPASGSVRDRRTH